MQHSAYLTLTDALALNCGQPAAFYGTLKRFLRDFRIWLREAEYRLQQNPGTTTSANELADHFSFAAHPGV